MRNILGIDVNAVLPGIASHLAHMGDAEQSAFFQVFADELLSGCGTRAMAEMQAAHINNKLTKEARTIFEMVGYKDER